MEISIKLKEILEQTGIRTLEDLEEMVASKGGKLSNKIKEEMTLFEKTFKYSNENLETNEYEL